MELYRGNNLLIQNFLLTSVRTFFSGRLFSSWLETWTRNESFEVCGLNTWEEWLVCTFFLWTMWFNTLLQTVSIKMIPI